MAVIEIMSPRNKHSDRAFRKFVRKAAGHLRRGIHLVIADVFPPSPRDPHGVHRAVWEVLSADKFDRPADKPLTFAGYDADPDGQTAYVEPAAVGDAVPDVPLFLRPGRYVPCPPSASYEATWAAFPAAVRGRVEG